MYLEWSRLLDKGIAPQIAPCLLPDPGVSSRPAGFDLDPGGAPPPLTQRSASDVRSSGTRHAIGLARASGKVVYIHRPTP